MSSNVLFGDSEGGGGPGAAPPFGGSDSFYGGGAWPQQQQQPTGNMAASGAYQRHNAFGPPLGGSGGMPDDIEDYENEPPLLQELGVDFSHIRTKVTAVLSASRARARSKCGARDGGVAGLPPDPPPTRTAAITTTCF